ncbi:MAG: hypothetical protein ACRDIB_03135, partial [Ardenticatenaceae bacterium]
MVTLDKTRHNGARARLIPLVLGTIVTLVALALLAATIVPWILWAYNVEEAGRDLDQGLVWPEPRSPNTLPRMRDEQSLEQALAHLAAAIRWRHDQAYAFRLASHVYGARREWLQAAEALEQARVIEP